MFQRERTFALVGIKKIAEILSSVLADGFRNRFEKGFYHIQFPLCKEFMVIVVEYKNKKNPALGGIYLYYKKFKLFSQISYHQKIC